MSVRRESDGDAMAEALAAPRRQQAPAAPVVLTSGEAHELAALMRRLEGVARHIPRDLRAEVRAARRMMDEAITR